jgi:glutathione peroxidase-family protein
VDLRSLLSHAINLCSKSQVRNNKNLLTNLGTEEEICEFAKKNYSVEFPIFHKIDVNGGNTDPLWSWLKKEQGGTL